MKYYIGDRKTQTRLMWQMPVFDLGIALTRMHGRIDRHFGLQNKYRRKK